MLVSPIIDGSSDVAPAAGHAGLPLPSVDNSFVQNMLWAPAAPQDTRANDVREIPMPRWRLAQEGPFLVERSPESIRSLGAGCAFRHTTYLIAPRTTQRQWGTIMMAYPCTNRGSSNGSGSPSRQDLSNVMVPSGSTNSHGTRPLRRPFIYNARFFYADQRGCPGSVCAIAPEVGVQDNRTLSGLPWVSAGRCGGGCPRPSGPPRRGTDGSNGAVASIVGSTAAPLE